MVPKFLQKNNNNQINDNKNNNNKLTFYNHLKHLCKKNSKQTESTKKN